MKSVRTTSEERSKGKEVREGGGRNISNIELNLHIYIISAVREDGKYQKKERKKRETS